MTGQLLVAQPGSAGAGLRDGLRSRRMFRERDLLREVTDVDEGVAAWSVGRVSAALGVVAFATSLLLLPALVATGTVRIDGDVLLAALGASLAAVMGGGKLAAVAGGLGARFVSAPRSRRAAARID